MGGCNKYCEINTVSLTYVLLQVLMWNNGSTVEKINDWNWCRQIKTIFQYLHFWNQEAIIVDNYNDISLLQLLPCKNTANLK